MTDSVFNVALKKRFTDSTEITTIDVTSGDMLLIRDSATGVVMRISFSTLTAAISSAQQTALDAKAPKASPSFSGTIATSGGIVKSSASTTISALNTPVSLTGTEAFSGIIRFRDRTLGGAAAFILDPNGGVQTIGTNQITGLSISFNSGAGNIVQAQITSGAVPRELNWSLFGGD